MTPEHLLQTSSPKCSSGLWLFLFVLYRKSEFGIGVELNAEGQKLMQVHQERLGRSLDRLSTELYSKDTHFVLELIQVAAHTSTLPQVWPLLKNPESPCSACFQNADDNSYQLEDGVIPALAFVMEKDCITVLNNETGFQEKNIKAICDVGCSTKGKHKYGYIGNYVPQPVLPLSKKTRGCR